VSSAQTLAFGILWLSVVVLGTLVLVLYREVERAYSISPVRQSGGLLAGVALPDLDIVEDAEVLLLPGLRSSGRFLLLFIKQSCDRREELLKLLQSSRSRLEPLSSC
jgi:hypothetical protein